MPRFRAGASMAAMAAMAAMERAEYDAAVLRLREGARRTEPRDRRAEGHALPPGAAIGAAIEAPTGAGSEPGR